MEDFWGIIRKWDPIIQFIFFLIVLGGFSSMVIGIFRYVTIMLHGWPPPEVVQEIEETEDD